MILLLILHDNPLCNNQECCDLVCEFDATCCDLNGTWDEYCVDLAKQVANSEGVNPCGCDQSTGACCPPAACGDDAGGVGNLTTPQTAGGGGDPVECDEECVEAQTLQECDQRPGWTWHENEPCCICQRNPDTEDLENVCPDGVGACCYGAQCQNGLTERECSASGGEWQGDNTVCESGICLDAGGSGSGTQAGGDQLF